MRDLNYELYGHMMKVFIILVSLSLLSCKRSESPARVPITASFKTYITHFRPLDLPFTYTDSDTTSIDNFYRINIHSTDTLFVKGDYLSEVVCFGMLNDTSEFYTLVYLFPAASNYPVIATYSKNGEVIDQKDIITNICGADEGLAYCSSTSIINTDLTIFAADTLKYVVIDSLGQLTSKILQTIIHSRSGTISRDGKVTISESVRKEF